MIKEWFFLLNLWVDYPKDSVRRDAVVMFSLLRIFCDASIGR